MAAGHRLASTRLRAAGGQYAAPRVLMFDMYGAAESATGSVSQSSWARNDVREVTLELTTLDESVLDVD